MMMMTTTHGSDIIASGNNIDDTVVAEVHGFLSIEP